MPIVTKVMLAPLVALVSLGTLSLFGGQMLDRQRDAIVGEYARVAPTIIRALTLPERLASVESELYKLSLWRSSGAEVGEILAAVDRKLDLAGRDIHALGQAGVSGADELAEVFRDYRQGVSQAAILIERNPVLGAVAVRGTERLFADIDRRARSVSARALRDLRVSTERADQAAAVISRQHLLVSIAAAFLVLLISLAVSRAITVPMRRMVLRIRGLRRGDIVAPVPLVRRRDELGEVARAVAGFRELLLANRTLEEERERQRRQLHHLAHHDTLTGLANRQAMSRFLARALADRRSRDLPLALLVLDLDNFKPVNDTFGHAAGDSVLVEVAERLRGVLREGDLPARLGGDEFAVILTGVRSRRDVEALAARVAATFETGFRWQGREIFLGASIGAALSTDVGRDAEALFAAADEAMYAAKREPAPAWRVYAAAVAGKDAGAGPGAELERAIRSHAIGPWYQPVFRLADGAPAGLAVCLRWRHPGRGVLDFENFVAEVESAGLLAEMIVATVRQVLRDLSGWLEASLDPGHASVGLPSAVLATASGSERLEWLLADRPEAARRLTIEIAESSLYGRAGQSVSNSLDRLHARGIRLALGDFGADRGALSPLRDGRFDEVRIHPGIVAGIGRDIGAGALIAATVAAADSLGVDVVAAGTLTLEQERHLRNMDCGFATGDLYGALAEADDTAERLRRQRPSICRRA